MRSVEWQESAWISHFVSIVDKTAKIDFMLPLGSVTETVTVSSEGAQIELSKADRGEVIDAERVQELPTDGRNPPYAHRTDPWRHEQREPPIYADGR